MSDPNKPADAGAYNAELNLAASTIVDLKEKLAATQKRIADLEQQGTRERVRTTAAKMGAAETALDDIADVLVPRLGEGDDIDAAVRAHLTARPYYLANGRPPAPPAAAPPTAQSVGAAFASHPTIAAQNAEAAWMTTYARGLTHTDPQVRQQASAEAERLRRGGK